MPDVHPVRGRPLGARLLALAACLVLAACAGMPERAGPVAPGDTRFMTETLDWLVPRAMARAAVPGVVVAVTDENGVLWSRAYGQGAAGQPLDPGARFRVGSVSKLLTAAEIMRRVDRGDIGLDAPVSTVLPGVVREEAGRPVTIRALLAHHGGLSPNHLRGLFVAEPQPLAAVDALVRDTPPLAPPQTRYIYSNLGYAVLGRVIERAGGQPFATAMDRGLLAPLGMTASAFERTATARGPVVTGHRRGEPVPPVGLRDDPAGGLVTDAAGLARFLRFVLNDGRGPDGRPLMRPATLDQMFQPQYAGLPLNFGRRLGLDWLLAGIDVPGVGPVAWHGGMTPGFHALVAVSRPHKLGVVVLANDEGAAELVKTVATKALELAREVKTGIAPPSPLPVVEPAEQAVPPAVLAALAGDYAIFGERVTMTAAGNRLKTTALGRAVELVPVAGDRFAVHTAVLGLFDVTLPGTAMRFAVVDGRRYGVVEGREAPLVFERLEDGAIPDAWRGRLGTYTGSDGDDMLTIHSFDLTIDRGVLTARVRSTSRTFGYDKGEGSVVLTPLSDDAAAVIGGDTLQGGPLVAGWQDGRPVLRFSGYTLVRTDVRTDGGRAE